MPTPRRARPHPESLTVTLLLTVLVALGQISTSLYVPSMPSLVTDLATDAATVKLTLSVFLLGFAVGQPLFGPLADRFGRRPMLLWGAGLYLVTSLACAMAPTIELLIAGRLAQGVAACSGPVLARAVVRDVYGAERSATAMAWIGAALAVSPAVAPLIGGILQQAFGWRAAFWCLVGVGFAVAAGVHRLLTETRPGHDGPAPGLASLLAGYRLLIGSRGFVGCTLAVAFVFAGLMAFAAASPFVFIDGLGLSPAAFGALAVFNVLGYLAGSLAAGRLAARWGLHRLLRIGLALGFAGGAVMAALAVAGVVGVTAIVAPMMVFTAGLGIVLPVGIAAAMAPHPRIAGTASAFLGFVQMVVAAAAAITVGTFEPTSPAPMAMVIAASAALAALAHVILVGPSAAATVRDGA